MKTPIFQGEIYHGKLTIYDRPSFDGYLTSIYGQVEVVVRKKKKQRSIEENAYYWGVVVKMIADYTGMTDDEAHEALKWKFLRKSFEDLSGQKKAFLQKVKEYILKKIGVEVDFIIGKLPTVRSTTKLNTVEMEKYLQEIRDWALEEYKLKIPLPNESE